MFKSKDGNTLTESISLDKTVNAPSILKGSVSCIDFTGQPSKQFAMCLPDKQTAENVIESYNLFMKCRVGDNLKNSSAQKMKNLLKASCLGLDVKFDLKDYNNDVNLAKAALDAAISKALIKTAKKLRDDFKVSKNETSTEQAIFK